MNLALLMALPHEAQGFFKDIPVHFCGVGKVNAAYHAAKLSQKGIDGILNLGTCGSQKIPPRSLVQCRSFFQRDMEIKAPGESLPRELVTQTLDLGYPWTSCGTGDRVETISPSSPWDIVDMEGYAIARVCALEKLQFMSYKYVTDMSDGHTVKDWKQNLHSAAQGLYDCLVRLKNQSPFLTFQGI